MKIIDLVYPPRCPFCGELSYAFAMCKSCAAGLEEMSRECPKCKKPRRLCLCRRSAAAGAAPAPFVYAGVVREAILSFKRTGDIECAKTFAAYIMEELSEKQAVDVVTAVPSTPKSYKKRGFNPAGLIAEELAKLASLPYEELLGCKNGKSQKSVERGEERILNVRDRFYAKQSSAVFGRRILIVDDLRTTGATLSACTEALLAAGAAEVFSVAFAAD